ncbi:hypothetical protein KIPB_005851, partial [Kipferlia bialata]
LDDDCLGWAVPPTTFAYILCFRLDREKEKLEREKGEAPESVSVPEKVWFTRQTVPNACCTVAILHSIFNSGVSLAPDSPLALFAQTTKDMSAEDRAAALHSATDIAELHKEFGQLGATGVPGTGEDIDLHYAAIVHVTHALTIQPSPSVHGPFPEGFVVAGAKVLRSLIAKGDQNSPFSVVALSTV